VGLLYFFYSVLFPLCKRGMTKQELGRLNEKTETEILKQPGKILKIFKNP